MCNICVFFLWQGDVTIVLEDYSAGNNSEVTVSKGQHVEILDPAPKGEPNWCLVRVLNMEDGEPAEGLVPISSLKPIPALKQHGNRDSMGDEGILRILSLNECFIMYDSWSFQCTQN